MGRKETKILSRWDRDHLSSSDPLGPRQERIVAKEKEMAEGRDVRQSINRLNSLNNDCCRNIGKYWCIRCYGESDCHQDSHVCAGTGQERLLGLQNKTSTFMLTLSRNYLESIPIQYQLPGVKCSTDSLPDMNSRPDIVSDWDHVTSTFEHVIRYH